MSRCRCWWATLRIIPATRFWIIAGADAGCGAGRRQLHQRLIVAATHGSRPSKLPHPTDKLDEQSARLIAVDQDVHAVITGEIDLRGDAYEISAAALDAVNGKVLAKSEVTVSPTSRTS